MLSERTLAGLVVGVALDVVTEEGLEEVVEGAAGFLAAPTSGLAPVVLGVVELDALEDTGLGLERLGLVSAWGRFFGLWVRGFFGLCVRGHGSSCSSN